jgi:hypothetical protein
LFLAKQSNACGKRGGGYAVDIKEQAYKDYEKGMKYRDIAGKYGISESAVKSWAARYWNKEKVATGVKKVATKEEKSCNRNGEKLQPKKRGKDGSPPLGNTNALKHGGYSFLYWDTLDEDERAMIEEMPTDEETLLVNQIHLFDVRERRIMGAINKYRDSKGGLVVSGVQTAYAKRAFDSEDERTLYNVLRQKKLDEGKISYLGYDKTTRTDTDASINIVQRLENELTRVQNAKTKAIAQLAVLREKRRADDEKHTRTENAGLLGDFLRIIQAADEGRGAENGGS